MLAATSAPNIPRTIQWSAIGHMVFILDGQSISKQETEFDALGMLANLRYSISALELWLQLED